MHNRRLIMLLNVISDDRDYLMIVTDLTGYEKWRLFLVSRDIAGKQKHRWIDLN